jgi:hypothetical protein
MKLDQAVGKKVVVGFKGDTRFFVSRVEGDRLVPVMIPSPDGSGASPVALPFLIGTLQASDDGYAIAYSETDVLGAQGDSSRSYVTVLNLDSIAYITYAKEQRVAIIGG